jgi:hypothetical protein
MFAHLRSAMCVAMSPNFTENRPPKPQQASASAISSSLRPGTLASSARGWAFTPSSRRPEHESW